MKEIDWNKYFEQEKLMCLKYGIETPTSPVIYKKNYFGNIYCEDINITKAHTST